MSYRSCWLAYSGCVQLDKTPTLGSIETSDGEKQKIAAQSMEYNVKDPAFRKLFPSLVKNFKRNLVVHNQVSQQTVVEEEGDDDNVESEQIVQTPQAAPPIYNNIKHNNSVNFRGINLLKAVSVAVTAVVFLSVLAYMYKWDMIVKYICNE